MSTHTTWTIRVLEFVGAGEASTASEFDRLGQGLTRAGYVNVGAPEFAKRDDLRDDDFDAYPATPGDYHVFSADSDTKGRRVVKILLTIDPELPLDAVLKEWKKGEFDKHK